MSKWSVPGLARHPNGLSEMWSWLNDLERFWSRAIIVLLIGMIPCGVTLLTLAFTAGLPEHRPLLAQQDVYRLMAGGDGTVVSRARYLAVGIAFQGLLTLVVTAFDLLVLYKLAFGKLPPWFRNDDREEDEHFSPSDERDGDTSKESGAKPESQESGES